MLVRDVDSDHAVPPDKNFAVGFLIAKIDLMERGVGGIEEWRGKGNFRVFKKKKNVTTALPSEANDTATTTDAALTKGRRKRRVAVMKKTEPGRRKRIPMGGIYSPTFNSNRNANRRCEQESQDAANKTLEISDSMVKEVGSVATDVTDKLTAGRCCDDD